MTYSNEIAARDSLLSQIEHVRLGLACRMPNTDSAVQELLFRAGDAVAALTSLIAERDGLREALTDIAAMTDPDDPESYRSDDREGCLDTVQAVARTALSLDTNKGDAKP